jgi:hypothetical protein
MRTVIAALSRLRPMSLRRERHRSAVLVGCASHCSMSISGGTCFPIRLSMSIAIEK